MIQQASTHWKKCAYCDGSGINHTTLDGACHGCAGTGAVAKEVSTPEPTKPGIPPERIFLQWFAVGDEPTTGEYDPDVVTWCQDRVSDSDVEYVLAERVNALEAALRLALAAAKQCLPEWEVPDDDHDRHICCEITNGDVRALLKAITTGEAALAPAEKP